MNFEGLEQFRYESTKQVMESMTKIAVDEKADIKDRFAAAKIVDGMSDSIIKAFIATETVQGQESTASKLLHGLDKLTDKD